MTARRIKQWRILLALCAVGMILTALYGPRIIESQYPSLKQDGEVDQKVTSVITRSKNPKMVAIQIYGLGKRYVSLTYQLKYTMNDKEYTIDMVATPINLLGKDEYAFDVPVQACTDIMCPASTRATKVWIGLNYTDVDGKIVSTGTP